MNISKLLSCFVCAMLLFNCSQKEKSTILSVKNTLDIERSFETVSLNQAFLKVENLNTLGIRDTETGALVISQMVDDNADGVMDAILFQPQVAASSEKHYEIVVISETEQPQSLDYCYSRFVPERTDDYTWENDKVAFRVYGPTAQKMIEDGVPGGTLSSGVDAWLKKVDYPIIDKWYKEFVDGISSYHEDTGEGLDNFHVGVSRGVGGIAIKADDSYHYSKNYIEWKTISTGPIRTSFYLNYEHWDASEKQIKESRIISLDRGSHFSKFSISLEGSTHISAGLTLHEKDGEVTGNDKNGWISYWQPHGDSELGMAIVATQNTFKGFETYNSDQQDLSNAYAHLNVENNKVEYYAGFGWKESGQFKTQQEWEQHLDAFSKMINTPLELSINH